MAGIKNIRALVDQTLDGKCGLFSWRKSIGTGTAGGGLSSGADWFDLSVQTGSPVPNYYAATPLTSTALARSTDGGLEHGGAVAPSQKYLRKMLVMSNAWGNPYFKVMDYLMYYPFVDESADGVVQTMTNSITLPRYPTGAGVQIMAVTTGARSSGGLSFTVNYTNSAGVANRTATSNISISSTTFRLGGIINSVAAPVGQVYSLNSPFLHLQGGDVGVRSIESVTINGAGGDGLFALVLVKPLVNMSARDAYGVVEVDYFLDFSTAPIIKDDAFLGMIGCTFSSSLEGYALQGFIETSWD